MAKEVGNIANQEIEKLKKQAEINEGYMVGLLWSNPFDHYIEYGDKLTYDDFVHDVFAFYFTLGYHLHRSGIKTFDDVSVQKMVQELNVKEQWKKYNGFETIEDLIGIVGESHDNIEHYYESIKRTKIIKDLYSLLGEKIFIKKNKYEYEKLTKEQLVRYWQNELNKIDMGMSDGHIQTENLYIDADEFIEKLQEDAEDLLPWYNSKLLNQMTLGIPRNTVTMVGGFGNSGKSSIVSSLFVTSCIKNQEKMIIVLNEESIQSLRQKIVLTIMYHELHTAIDRKKMVNGNLSEDDKDKIRKAFARMKELMDGHDSQIVVLFMEKYTMDNLEKVIRNYALRGYSNLWIDTAKVTDDMHGEARWENFTESLKKIYKLSRAEAGGCSLRTVVTVQLADAHTKARYLSFEALGEGRKAKDETSLCIFFRNLFADEMPDGKKPLEVYRYEFHELTGRFEKKIVSLDKDKHYLALFVVKNRNNQNVDSGLQVLIVEAQFNNNNFKEIGYTHIARDFI